MCKVKIIYFPSPLYQEYYWKNFWGCREHIYAISEKIRLIARGASGFLTFPPEQDKLLFRFQEKPFYIDSLGLWHKVTLSDFPSRYRFSDIKLIYGYWRYAGRDKSDQFVSEVYDEEGKNIPSGSAMSLVSNEDVILLNYEYLENNTEIAFYRPDMSLRFRHADRWKSEHLYTPPVSLPSCYVVNDGARKDEKGYWHEGGVTALDKESGEVMWRYEVPTKIDQLSASGNTVCLTSAGEVILLDGDDGSERLRIVALDAGERTTKAFLCGDYIALFNGSSVEDGKRPNKNQITIFDVENGRVVREFDLPAGLTFDTKRNMFPKDAHRWIMPLTFSSIACQHYGGLLELDVRDILAPLDVDTGPEFIQTELLNEDGSVWYSLRVSDSFLDDILRWGEIRIKDLAVLKGRSAYNNRAYNKKFNGQILLEIERSALRDSDDADKRLDELCDCINAWSQEDGFISGDRKSYVTATWCYI